MKKITLSLMNSISQKKCKIYIDLDCIQKIGEYTQKYYSDCQNRKAIIFSDQRLKKYAHALKRSLSLYFHNVDIIWIPGNEKSKSYSYSYSIYGKLLEMGADRQTILFALGGGVIGDLTGYIAGTYMRGIPWVGVPTTLLAQVDSCLGGKTGINHEIGKNLIGLFYHPDMIFCDVQLLKSLPQREWISGFGEVIKYGLIFDPPLFEMIHQSWSNLERLDSSDLCELVFRSLKWKAKVVEQDEFEKQGKRALLNFGHTLGHAIEALTHYHYYKHGEAVILGMRGALSLSHQLRNLDQKEYSRMDDFLSRIKIPEVPKNLKMKRLIDRLKWDKKATRGNIKFILLKKLGEAYIEDQVEIRSIQIALKAIGLD